MAGRTRVFEVRGGKRGIATFMEESQYRQFRVIMEELDSSSSSDALNAVASYLGFRWDYPPTFPGRGDLFVCEMSVSQVDEEPIFLVDVKYSASYAYFHEVVPTLQPCSINWTYKPYSQVLSVDFQGNVIASSAGELFVPPYEEPVFHPCCSIVRNEFTFDPEVAYDYMNKVNGDNFWLAGAEISPGYALMRNVACNRKYWKDFPYYEVSYEIEINPETWMTYLLDHGTFYLDENGNRKLFRVEGEPADRPMNLNGAGAPLPPGTPDNPSFGIFLPFVTKDVRAFSFLGLPVTMTDPGV